MPSKEKIPWISQGHQTYVADFTEISNKTIGFNGKRMRGEFIADLSYFFSNSQHQCDLKIKPVELGSTPFSSNDVSPPPTFWSIAQGTPPAWLPAPYWKNTGNNEVLSLDRQVRNALRNKASAVDFNVVQAAAEVKDTASTIENVATTVWKSFRELCRGQPLKAVQTLIYGPGPGRSLNDLGKGLTNNWLQWSYGIKPLIQDVEGAMTALDKSKDRPRTVILISRAERSYSGQGQWKSGNHRLDDIRYFFCVGKITCTGKIFANVTSPVTKTADELGLLNPALLAWELIPYSFVVDWFMPVGTYLQCMVPIRGLSLKSGWIYMKGKAFMKTTYGWNQVSSSGRVKSEFKDRQVLTGFPEFVMPAPDFSLSVSQAISAISLLAQKVL